MAQSEKQLLLIDLSAANDARGRTLREVISFIASIPTEEEQSGTSEKPNTQWSEEDERHLKNLLAYFSGIEKTSPYYEDFVWLKSLRPSWKPSEEQIECLRKTLAKETGYERTILRSLFQELITLL